MGFREWLLKVLGCQTQYWHDQYDLMYEGIVRKDTIIAELKAKINELEEQNSYEDDSMRPTWLDTSQVPYEPLIEIEGEQIILKPQDIYMECKTFRDMIVKLRNLPLDQKLIEIWKIVINALIYKYDKNENWLPPIVSYMRRYGDCEDGTIIFVTFCRLAHAKADSIFNACGLYDKKYGHSYPIAKMSDGKWYIFETTLDSMPKEPKLFKGSNYTAEWGYANWKYAGKGPEQV